VEPSASGDLGDQPTLPVNRAFVVQFRRTTSCDEAVDVGRVEHLTSGTATHFDTWPELHRFVEEVLDAERGGPAEGSAAD
jgi:hypothetical protein